MTVIIYLHHVDNSFFLFFILPVSRYLFTDFLRWVGYPSVYAILFKLK